MRKRIIILPFLIFLIFLPHQAVSAADCSEASASGNLIITTACTFAGTVNGVDAGSGTSNSAQLVLSAGGSLTIGGTQTIALGSLQMNGGATVIFDGGAIKIGTPIFMVDADGDAFPDTATQYATTTPPLGGVRRSLLASHTVVDSNPNQSCPPNTNPAGSCNTCTNGALANQADGADAFAECATFYACNGSGACSLHAKRIFVTSTTTRGYTNGVAGADTSCQNLANRVSLGGSWKAWLSSQTQSAASRLSQSSYPYILVDQSSKIANNWADLADGTLLAGISKDETGAAVAAATAVWTNTTAEGGIFATTSRTTCNNWGSASGLNDGLYGLAGDATAAWTNSVSAACNVFRRLYCVEQ